MSSNLKKRLVSCHTTAMSARYSYPPEAFCNRFSQIQPDRKKTICFFCLVKLFTFFEYFSDFFDEIFRYLCYTVFLQEYASLVFWVLQPY